MSNWIIIFSFISLPTSKFLYCTELYGLHIRRTSTRAWTLHINLPQCPGWGCLSAYARWFWSWGCWWEETCWRGRWLWSGSSWKFDAGSWGGLWSLRRWWSARRSCSPSSWGVHPPWGRGHAGTNLPESCHRSSHSQVTAHVPFSTWWHCLYADIPVCNPVTKMVIKTGSSNKYVLTYLQWHTDYWPSGYFLYI